MFNYENGKRLVTAGFAFSLVIVIINVAVSLFGYIIMGGIGPAFANILNILRIVSAISVCITVGGYGIMWLCNRGLLDLVLAGLLVLDMLGSAFLIRFLGFHFSVSNFLLGLLSAAFYLVLAIRIKDKNRMLFLLLGCAVLFRVATTLYDFYIPRLLPYVLVYMVAGAGNIVCAGLCFLASKQD